MKWHKKTENIFFSSSQVDFDTFCPMVIVEINGKSINVGEEIVYLDESIKKTDFGEGICRRFLSKTSEIYVLNEITIGNNFAYFEQTLENNSHNEINWVVGGFKTDTARILKASAQDFTVYSLHKNEVEGVLGEKKDAHSQLFYQETLMIYRDEGKVGFTISPVGTAEAFIKCHYSYEGEALSIKVESDMCSVRVDKGEKRSAQSFIIFDKDATSAINEVIKDLAKNLGTRVSKSAPYGWCSWYYRFNSVDEKDVFNIIDYYGSHKEIPTPHYVQIDEGWEKHWGEWQENEKFPSGIEEFVRRANDIGTLPGLWVIPTWIKKELPVFKNNPDWIARYPNGEYAVTSNWIDGECHGIDITNPKAVDFAVSTVKKLYEKGIRYFKIDFNEFYVNGHTSYSSKLTSLQAYRRLFSAYRAVVPKAYINASTASLNRGVIGYADSCRIAADVDRDWKTRGDNITIYQQMPSCAIKAFANGVLFYNDPDVLYFIGEERLNEMHRRIWLSFVALSGGAVGHSEIAEVLKENPIEQGFVWKPSIETAKPVYPCTFCESQRFGFVAKRSYGDFGVFLLWNAKKEPFYTMLSPMLSQIGEKFHVFSFWDKKYLGVRTANSLLDLSFETGGVYRYTPVSTSKKPLLIASCLHLSMGANEIKEMIDNGSNVVISFCDDGAQDGELFFYSESKILAVDCVNCEAALNFNGDNVYEIKIKNRQKESKICVKYCIS